MQAIVETLFDAVYLTSVIAIGVTMIVKSRGNKEYWLFGIMRSCSSAPATPSIWSPGLWLSAPLVWKTLSSPWA